MPNNTVIIVPTYNEKSNIPELIKEINSYNLPVDILVVDDNSPDGTGELAESIKKTTPNLDIIHRQKKEGLGPAYIEAFRHVLDKGIHDYIFEMDADFSHDPNEIPNFLKAIEKADLVLGARYIPGGDMRIEKLENLPVSWAMFMLVLFFVHPCMT